jgi:hypothetical protein
MATISPKIGKLFGNSLMAVCENDNQQTPILVGLFLFSVPLLRSKKVG